MAHIRRVRLGLLSAVLLGVGAAPAAYAAVIGPPHITDAIFGAGEWSERPTVSKKIFTRGSDGSGGAALYVEQGTVFGTNKLYLMYDYYKPADLNFLNPGVNVSFSVFFQIPRDNEDYLVEIAKRGITGVFTKPASQPSGTNPDGTLNSGAPWVLATPADLASGQFLGKVGFGTSPDSPTTPHPLAEFELTFDQTAFSNPPLNPQPGLYDPAPAFWAAGASGSFFAASTTVSFDPPISSGIFQLNPNGTTDVTPFLNRDTGGPVAQDNVLEPASLPEPATLPEPASLLLTGAGLLGLAGLRRGRR